MAVHVTKLPLPLLRWIAASGQNVRSYISTGHVSAIRSFFCGRRFAIPLAPFNKDSYGTYLHDDGGFRGRA